MITSLSEFQIATELELIERLHAAGLTFDRRRVGGKEEPYVEGYVKDVHVWLYHDRGASVVGRGLDRMFEKWDYRSPEELRTAIVDSVLALFER